MTLWDKGTAAADWVTRFTVGEDWRWDTLLLPYDVEGTRAHAWALTQLGVLTGDELGQVESALDAIRDRALGGNLTVTVHDEDAHTVIEHELTERLGDVGQKIHAGRSRNDQVLVALRLWLRDALAAVAAEALDTAEALTDLAARHDDLLMPGYTHLQRAMPTTVGLWAAAYAELLADDLGRLAATRTRADVSPWGSAAGYGVPRLDLQREAVADRLGFRGLQRHVPAVQLSRGKLEADVVHALVQLGATANRLASDLVLFASAEFGFVRLPAEYTTGSSIMPQKRNPDVLELARATYHRLTAELHLLLGLPANLPSGYHRDLQLTKEATMRAVLTARDLFTALRHLLPGLTFDEERLRVAVTSELFATDAALALVQQGTPFRQAYRQAAAQEHGEVPSDALRAYTGVGMPGRAEPDALRRALGELRERLDARPS
jgi:argininosuccinate lyase